MKMKDKLYAVDSLLLQGIDFDEDTLGFGQTQAIAVNTQATQNKKGNDTNKNIKKGAT